MSIYADEGTAAHEVLEQALLTIYDVGLPSEAVHYEGAKLTIEDGPHGSLSPSGAKRWTTCPAAPAMEARFPEFHLGPREVVFEGDYVAAVQTCLDYVEEQVRLYTQATGHCQVLAERRVSPRAYLHTDECDGTADITLIAGDPAAPVHIEIVDFKAGAGVFVDVTDPQMELYLLGAMADLSSTLALRSATITVVQPRCIDSGGPPVRSREIDNIKEWTPGRADYFRTKIIETQNPDAPCRPSENACRFCTARGACSAHQEWALRQAGFLPDDVGLDSDSIDLVDIAAIDTRVLSDTALRKLLDARAVLVGALQAAEAWALDQLMSGNAGPDVARGYKVVRGRSQRRWAQDDDATEAALKKIKIEDPSTGKKRGLGRKDVTETKLLSLSQVEKLLTNLGVPKRDARFDALARLATKPEGKLTIAPRDDPRPGEAAARAAPAPEDAFAEIPADEPPPAFIG